MLNIYRRLTSWDAVTKLHTMSGEMVNQSWVSDSGPIPENAVKAVMLSTCSIEFVGKKSKGIGFLLKVQANHTTAVKGFLTNNDVITDKDIRHKGTFVLKFDHLPTPLEIKVSLKDCDYTYFSDVASMDATFIALPGCAINQLDDAGAVWLSIHPDDAKVGEKVFTIQHPAVQSKGNLSFAHGEVKGTESQTGKTSSHIFVKHSADTEPGSSGSPVMTYDGRLIGLHRCSVSEAPKGATNARCILKAIIEDFAELAEGYPDIAQSISEASSKSIRCRSCSSNGGDPMDIEGTIYNSIYRHSLIS